MRTFTHGSGITGAADLQRRLAELADAALAIRMGNAAVHKGAVVVQSAVAANAPVGPKPNSGGHAKIKDNVRIKLGKGRTPGTAVYLVHNGDAFQAGFIERGTIHMAPRPFFGPAFASSKDAAMSAMGNALSQMLDNVARGGSSGATGTNG